MDKRKKFDDIIKSTLEGSTKDIEPTREIFNEAWMKKDESSIRHKSFTIKPVLRICIVTTCLIAFLFTTMIIASPKARSIALEAYNSLRTIFVIEKVGDEYVTVEKPADIEYEFENLGGVTIDDSKREAFEKIMGFKLHFPQRLGEYYNRRYYPNGGITVYNVKLKDVEQNRDKFLQAILNEKTYSNLSKFDMGRWVSTTYTDKMGEGFFFYIGKHTHKYFGPNKKVIKKFDIDGVDCEIIESTRASYPWKSEGDWRFEDMTQEPEKILKLYYLVWYYDGVKYSITPSGAPGTKEFDEENAISFAKVYIKSFKSSLNK